MMKNWRKAFLSRLRRYFLSGLLVWLPIWATIVVIKFLVDILDNFLLLLPVGYRPDALLGFHIPGIGVVLTLLVIISTGIMAANILGRQLVAFWDAIVGHIPLVRTIHTSVKQILETLLTPNGQSFRKVLLVEFPRKGMWSLAFQTGDATTEVGAALADDDMVSLFIPTTPNITSGFMVMMPRNKVIELKMPVDQALKYVISLGVMNIEKKKK